MLSRSLAHAGHYPGRSTSCRASRACSARSSAPEVVEAGQLLRAALAVLSEKEDLVSIGAYQHGSDPALDAALAHRAADRGVPAPARRRTQRPAGDRPRPRRARRIPAREPHVARGAEVEDAEDMLPGVPRPIAGGRGRAGDPGARPEPLSGGGRVWPVARARACSAKEPRRRGRLTGRARTLVPFPPRACPRGARAPRERSPSRSLRVDLASVEQSSRAALSRRDLEQRAGRTARRGRKRPAPSARPSCSPARPSSSGSRPSGGCARIELARSEAEVAERNATLITAAGEHEMLKRLRERRRGEHEREAGARRAQRPRRDRHRPPRQVEQHERRTAHQRRRRRARDRAAHRAVRSTDRAGPPGKRPSDRAERRRPPRRPAGFACALQAATRRPGRRASRPPAATLRSGEQAASGEYEALIQQAAQRYGIDPAVLHGLIQQESGFDPTPRAAQGRWGSRS